MNCRFCVFLLIFVSIFFPHSSAQLIENVLKYKNDYAISVLMDTLMVGLNVSHHLLIAPDSVPVEQDVTFHCFNP
jgi:hypothetical protein